MEDFVAYVTKQPVFEPPFLMSTSPAYNHGYVNFITQMSITKEPKSYKDAKEDNKWVEAMQAELSALEDNNNWELTVLPKGKKVVDFKWVYRIKYNADSSINKYKARLIVKSYNQEFSINYYDSFSPVVKMVTIRLFFTVTVVNDQLVYQLDISNTYLHEFVEEELYLRPPEGYSKASKGQVCHLTKSLYGLKQVGCQSNKELTSNLQSIRFTKSEADHCLFTTGTKKNYVGVVVYVDDLLIGGPDDKEIHKVKSPWMKSSW